MSVAQHPKFCSAEHRDSNAAEAEARPNVYSDSGVTSWDSVSSGWNTACGEIPSNFTVVAEQYASETGGLPLIENDSGFKESAWTFSNFQVWKVKSVGPAGSYPYGERAQTIAQMSRLFSVNLFWMPTATSESVGWYNLEYEVCAYFADPNGEVPNKRLYKTTVSPLGDTEPFVQEFVRAISTTEVEYIAISPRYNDDGDGVGAVQFVSEVTETCPVWSGGILALIIVLCFVFVLVLIGLGLCAWKKKFEA